MDEERGLGDGIGAVSASQMAPLSGLRGFSPIARLGTSRESPDFTYRDVIVVPKDGH
jgi:hypothetical protein